MHFKQKRLWSTLTKKTRFKWVFRGVPNAFQTKTPLSCLCDKLLAGFISITGFKLFVTTLETYKGKAYGHNSACATNKECPNSQTRCCYNTTYLYCLLSRRGGNYQKQTCCCCEGSDSSDRNHSSVIRKVSDSRSGWLRKATGVFGTWRQCPQHAYCQSVVSPWEPCSALALLLLWCCSRNQSTNRKKEELKCLHL